VLLDAAQAQPGVTLHFQQRCLRFEKQDTCEGQGTRLLFQNAVTHRIESVSADWIIGADGVFSAIRQQMQRDLLIETRQESLEWGYKEISILARPDGKHVFANNVFHMWPRGECMLMAVPNQDGSFTGTCVLPFQGKLSLATLQSREEILSFFKTHFADALPWIPSLVEDFQHNPVGEFITLYTSPWHYHDRVVLIGDACHSFVPFYGQGMNASLADCQLLSVCLGQGGEDYELAFKAYQRLRKKHTDAMAQLSKENFTEIRDKVRSPFFVLYKNIDLLLNKLFPGIWVPLYSLIMYTNIPYADAIARVKKQEQLLKWFALTLLLPGMGGILRIVFMHFSGGRRRSR
jgi:kynurenine 3-monooxygenase